VAENHPAGTAVGTLSTTDPDAGGTFTYTLVSGDGSTDNASFKIVGSQLQTNTSFDYETKNRCSIRVRSTDAGGLSVERSFTITVTNVNEAPTVTMPASFTVVEDVRGNLIWPAEAVPFTDVDSPNLTVTLAVADGTMSAASAGGVTVGGTATNRTFAGTQASLNAYFRTLGRIGYTTAPDNTAARVLTMTVSDGALVATKTSTIAITPVNDPPQLNPTARLTAPRTGGSVEVTHAMLQAATAARDSDGGAVQFRIDSLQAGHIEVWNGRRWVMAASVQPPVGRAVRASTVLIKPGKRFRWVPPSNASGVVAAFTVRAWDGQLVSPGTSRVSVKLQ
jgi:hypothetical protein